MHGKNQHYEVNKNKWIIMMYDFTSNLIQMYKKMFICHNFPDTEVGISRNKSEFASMSVMSSEKNISSKTAFVFKLTVCTKVRFHVRLPRST